MTDAGKIFNKIKLNYFNIKAHLLSDILGYLISVFSLRLSLQKSGNKLTYGYARADIIGAMGSVFIIWILTGWLLYEAYLRLVFRLNILLYYIIFI